METLHIWSSIYKAKFGYRWVIVHCHMDDDGEIKIMNLANGWVPLRFIASSVADKYLRVIKKLLIDSKEKE